MPLQLYKLYREKRRLGGMNTHAETSLAILLMIFSSQTVGAKVEIRLIFMQDLLGEQWHITHYHVFLKTMQNAECSSGPSVSDLDVCKQVMKLLTLTFIG